MIATKPCANYQRTELCISKILHSSSKGPLVLCKLKECTIGALVITNTVLGAPYDNYSIMGPFKGTLF